MMHEIPAGSFAAIEFRVAAEDQVTFVVREVEFEFAIVQRVRVRCS